MTDTTLIEHVARAICRADGLDPDDVCEQTNVTYWTMYNEQAQAAIDAVMERLGLSEINQKTLRVGLQILACNANGMTYSEWNNFSNVILEMLAAASGDGQ